MADYKHVTSRKKTMTLQHGEASEDDLYAMAKLCDTAAEPGWPTDFLPPQRTTIAPARRSD